MPILNIKTSEVGLVGVKPSIIYIDTNDTLEQVTATGYLNKAVQSGALIAEWNMALVTTKETPNASTTQVALLEVSRTGSDWSLVPTGSPGSVIIPTLIRNMAYFANTDGLLRSGADLVTHTGSFQTWGDMAVGVNGGSRLLIIRPANATGRGSLRFQATNTTSGDHHTLITNAAMNGARTITIPNPGQASSNFILSASSTEQEISNGDLLITHGTLQVGTDSTPNTNGIIRMFSINGTGELALIPVNNSGGSFEMSISNAASFGQNQNVTIPDAGATTANFLLDTGAGNIISYQQFVGLDSVIDFGVGTWTTIRNGAGDYYTQHTPADEASRVSIDIDPMIRTAASKGFRLNSIQVIYGVTSANLDSLAADLLITTYSNGNTPVATPVPTTGTFPLTTVGGTHIVNLTVDTPAFNNTANSKYVLELLVDNSATSEFDYYGLFLNFNQTIA